MSTSSFAPHGLARPSLGIDYAAQLNEEQLGAVEAGEGPVLVLAGAGSGKTRTLTFRVARLLERGVPPEGLLLLTFTNKAAREMTRRVAELAGGHVDARRILGGTFHHAAHALLRQHASRVGFSESFTVLDREDAAALLASCLAERKAPRGERRLPRADVLLELISSAANLQRPLAELLEARRPQLLPLADEVLALAQRFAWRKQQLDVMDFDDLLVHLRRLLLEVPEVRARLVERFHCVLVDEYQDTNRLQGELVDLLAGERRNLTVVGDDCQSIYGFRGADFSNIIDFPQRYPGCALHTLTRNYRSTPQVLRLANASIAQNPRQFPKRLSATRPDGPVPLVVPCVDAGEQASFVARRVLELRAQGVPLEQMAVLYRAHAHSLELQLELTRQGIPFRVRSGVRFFEQAHVKDVLAHLRWVHNPTDELAFKRAVRLVDGVGQASAEALWTALRTRPTGLPLAELLAHPDVQGLVPRRAAAGLRRFSQLVGLLEQAATPGRMVEAVLEGGYGDVLRAGFEAEEAARRAEELRQLAEFSGRFDSLPRLLSEVALLSELSAEGGEPAGGLLTLSTIHQAKGLEWRAVFVLWLCEGRFPLMASTRTREDEEEERRLFHVAVTRAMDWLLLTHPLTTHLRGGAPMMLRLSRFIDELPCEGDAPYERLILESEPPPGRPPAPGPEGPSLAAREPPEDLEGA